MRKDKIYELTAYDADVPVNEKEASYGIVGNKKVKDLGVDPYTGIDRESDEDFMNRICPPSGVDDENFD